jgi:hypothetical protein
MVLSHLDFEQTCVVGYSRHHGRKEIERTGNTPVSGRILSRECQYANRNVQTTRWVPGRGMCLLNGVAARAQVTVFCSGGHQTPTLSFWLKTEQTGFGLERVFKRLMASSGSVSSFRDLTSFRSLKSRWLITVS